ncbi:MAG: type II toxin-antitoxin system RelE/ParE family toxin [Pyrinomonadaceae bacterium]|nr:type II toxin-antitoxin system RelE/ParE family toxin [Pyrinomonadaceae bacterium]
MKRKSVITRQKAEEDIDRAFEYYLQEAGPEMAVAFVDGFERSTAQLSRNPLSGSSQLAHALGIDDLRQLPMKRFPYVLIYIDTKQCVEIWRVLHTRRDLLSLLDADE